MPKFFLVIHPTLHLNRTTYAPYPIHSFIHYMDLYSASSRLLLRSAPDSSTAKRNSFKARVQCVHPSPSSGIYILIRKTSSKLNNEKDRELEIHVKSERTSRSRRSHFPPIST